MRLLERLGKGLALGQRRKLLKNRVLKVSISIYQAAIFLGSITLMGACIGAAPSDLAPIRVGPLNYGLEDYSAYQVSKVTDDYELINNPRITSVAGWSRSSPAGCTANSNGLI
jgi:hypothetical protein